MTTRSQERLPGLALVAVLGAVGGELLGMPLLVATGVTSLFLAVAGLLASMTVALVVGVSQTSGPDMHDPTVPDQDC